MLPDRKTVSRQANTLATVTIRMTFQMECPECDEHREFVQDDNPADDDLSTEAEDIPRINLKCEDCGHQVRLWDSDITSLFL